MTFRIGVAGLAAPLLASVLVARMVAAQAGASSPSTADAPAIVADDLRRHIAALTDAAIGPRVLGSPGLERTAQYVAEQFKQLGLLPSASVRNVFSAFAFRREPPDTTS